jgi:hypothetical protein
VEVEFIGPDIAEAVEVLKVALEAEHEAISDHEHLLHSPLNDQPFRLEVDFEWLMTLSREKDQEHSALKELAVEVLDAASSLAVPLELVTPPLPFEEISLVERLVDALETIDAVGSQDSWAYAFGTHFNPGLEDLSAANIKRHIQAFVCLYEWLKMKDHVDLSRQISPYVRAYPIEYEKLVLQADYEPSISQLIDDYLQHNDTRNRALDMLPMFAHIDEDRVRAIVSDTKVKARPTFHYRLPNSRVGDPDWSVLDAWDNWLLVEKLAANDTALKRLLLARLNFLQHKSMLEGKNKWLEQCEAAVRDL